MGFWNRFTKNEDPLLKVLLERYRLNLLSIPREKASVGDLYVQEGNSQYVSTPGSITNFLEPSFEVPSITTGEIMAGVSGTTSRDASGKVGVDFLEGFVNALGPAGIGTKVCGSYESGTKNKINCSQSGECYSCCKCMWGVVPTERVLWCRGVVNLVEKKTFLRVNTTMPAVTFP